MASNCQQPRQTLTLVAPDPQAQLGRLALERPLQQPDAELVPHVTSYAMFAGDFYGVCICCDAISLPVFSLEAAKRWSCPRSVAEIECARNQRLWERRNDAARDAGYR